MAKKKSKSNRLIYWLIGGVVLLLTVFVIGRSQGWIGKSDELQVELANVQRNTIVEKVSASGMVQPVTEVRLSPEVSGEIINLTVEEGDSVRKGELLVKIRPDSWISQLERAEASLNQQRANLQSARASLSRATATSIRSEQEYQRQKRLWDEKVISEADWQLAEQNHKIAQNDLASADQSVVAAEYIVKSSVAAVNEARENVRRTSVMAPMSGTVSKLGVKQGERVVGTAQMQGTEMLRIADLSKMEVRVDVNENDIVKVHMGDSASIDVDAYPDKKFKGMVTLIANTAKEKTSTDAITEFEVRILMLSSSYADLVQGGKRYPFRPGMTASVDITTNRKDTVISVPLAAVTTRNPEGGAEESATGNNRNQNQTASSNTAPTPRKEDKIVVFVNDSGKAKMVEVKTGLSDYDNIEILSGVTEGQMVVKGPFLVVSKRLKDGDAIRVEEMKEPSAPETSK